MSNKPSGRFSSYPKVNRGTPPVEPEVVVATVPEPEEVVNTAPPAWWTEDVPEIVEDEEASDEAAEDVAEDASTGADDIAEMTAKEVLEWVGDDPDRREHALVTERSGRGRKTLLSRLTEG